MPVLFGSCYDHPLQNVLYRTVPASCDILPFSWAMFQRLEDRIKQLCAKVLSTPESPELNEVLKQLQDALHEHTNRLRNMVASRRIRTEPRSLTFDVVDRCAICGKPIMLEEAKVTEEGRAVHGKCSVAKEP